MAFSTAEIAEQHEQFPDDEDWAHAAEHFHEIPQAEGLARTPHLRGNPTQWVQGHLGQTIIPAMVEHTTHFYECDRYDNWKHRCSAYDERPPLCRGYPYGSTSALELPESCVHISLKPKPSAS